MNTQNQPPQGKTAASILSPVLIRVLIAAAVLLLLMFGLYWAGLSHGRGEMAQQKADDMTQLKAAQTKTADAQAQVDALQTQNQLMTARGLLYQGAIALDRRNFGIANDDVEKARETLVAAKPADPGVEGKLGVVRSAVTGTKITVAENLDDQRSHLLTLATQLDALTH
jgi:hypothetical protein